MANIMEEVDSGKFFEHIDDLLEFPNDEDVDDGIFGSGDAFPPVWLGDSADCNSNSASDLSVERSVRYEDIVQLEWLSSFVQDSFPKVKAFPICHAKRPRSKRPRPATFTPRAAIQLIPSTYFAESCAFKKRLEPQKKRKYKGASVSGGSDRMSHSQNGDLNATPVRKCLHCEITETPQWRAGPMGPKTLCNACGVRFKSGRLFPEYRPAASPTFVPSLHSNSHRKVIEMRKGRPTEEKSVIAEAAAAPATSCQPELLPNVLSAWM